MTDIAIACQLVNLRHGEEALDAQRWPRLAAHFERTLARPALAEIVQGELQIIAKIMAKR